MGVSERRLPRLCPSKPAGVPRVKQGPPMGSGEDPKSPEPWEDAPAPTVSGEPTGSSPAVGKAGERPSNSNASSAKKLMLPGEKEVRGGKA